MRERSATLKRMRILFAAVPAYGQVFPWRRWPKPHLLKDEPLRRSRVEAARREIALMPSPGEVLARLTSDPSA